MQNATKGASLQVRMVRLVMIWAAAFTFGLQTAAPAHANPGMSGVAVGDAVPVALASAGVAISPVGADLSTPLSDTQMSATVGAGFWSSLWEGMKLAGEAILFIGVWYLVFELCNLEYVTCYVT